MWVYITEICGIQSAFLVYLTFFGSLVLFTCIFPNFYNDFNFIGFFLFAIASAICFVITNFMTEINFGVPSEKRRESFDESFLQET